MSAKDSRTCREHSIRGCLGLLYNPAQDSHPSICLGPGSVDMRVDCSLEDCGRERQQSLLEARVRE